MAAWPGARAFATWEEAELMEEAMVSSPGTAGAQALGVKPRPLAAVLQTQTRRHPADGG